MTTPDRHLYAVPKPDPLLTVQEIARALRVSKMTIYRLTDEGLLPHVRIGRSIRVRKSAVTAYLNAVAVRTDPGAC